MKTIIADKIASVAQHNNLQRKLRVCDAIMGQLKPPLTRVILRNQVEPLRRQA